MILKTVIIDDELHAVKSIELIVKDFCSNIEIVGTANTIDEGRNIILKKKPDLVFLDIEMPRGSGFDLLERFPVRKFDVIFITAHNKYKIKSENYDIFEYLLKPIDIDELIKTVNKIIDFRKKNPGKLYKKTPKF